MKCYCPILGRSTIVDETEFSNDQWTIVRCQETGFVFLANPPEYSQLSEEFAWEKTYLNESERRGKSEPVKQSISDFLKQLKYRLFPKRNHIWSIMQSLPMVRHATESVRVLDIGCAAGGMMVALCELAEACGKKITPYGIEISKQLAASASDNFRLLGGVAVHNSAIGGVAELPEEGIDLAVMRSFLEHESKPLELLAQLHPILSSQGLVVIKVPNFNCLNRFFRKGRWCGFRYPDHVNYFTPQTLSMLAERAGYRVVRQRWIDKLPLSDNMYAVLEKANIPQEHLKNAA